MLLRWQEQRICDAFYLQGFIANKFAPTIVGPYLIPREVLMKSEITADIAQALGHYVYAYIDPRDDSIFYIGKGVGSRATSHLFEQAESEKVARIDAIRATGAEPRIDIMAQNLRDDEEASRVEAALIDLVGVANLTNRVRGRFSVENPRRPLLDIITEHTAEPADICDPTLLIRINRQFRYGMSAEALYECTRGIWVVGERRNRAKLAMAVYAGIVREVYEIASWHPAGTTAYSTRNQQELAQHKDKRWEFVGTVANEAIRKRYLGKSVAHLFRTGQQNPLVGIGLDMTSHSS